MRTHIHIGRILAVLVLIIFAVQGREILGIPLVSAALGGDPAEPINKALLDFMGIISALTQFAHFLLIIVLWILQYLLSSMWFTDPGMMDYLHNIWLLSRNIMNMLFALMLIGVAFYTIIMADSKFVKEKIAKFAIAVVLVNFSWFFPRVILDVANVLTATIYNIPHALPGFSCQTMEYDDVTKTTVPTECIVATKVVVYPTPEQKAEFCPGGYVKKKCTCVGLVCVKFDTYSKALAGGKPMAHATINGLALSFAKLATMNQVPRGLAEMGVEVPGGSSVQTQFMITTFLVFGLQLMLLLPMIALAAAMLIRTLILWITMAFMPFVFLGYVVTGSLGTGVFGMEDYVWKNFISSAFLPAMVALPLTIGFIMLSSVTLIPIPDLGLTMGMPIISGVGNIWGLMWIGAAAMVIWTGVFAALEKNNAVKGIAGKIKGFGETIGGAAAKLPLLAPIPLPGVPGGGKMNLGDIVHAPRQLSNALDQKTGGYNLQRTLAEAMGERRATPGVDGMEKVIRNNKDETNRLIAAIKEAQANPSGGADLKAILSAHSITTTGREDAMQKALELAEFHNRNAGSSANGELVGLIPELRRKLEEAKAAARPTTPPPTAPPPTTP